MIAFSGELPRNTEIEIVVRSRLRAKGRYNRTLLAMTLVGRRRCDLTKLDERLCVQLNTVSLFLR